MTKTCKVHPNATLITYCPACRGALGGRKTSPAKTRAVIRNLKTARKRKKRAKKLVDPGW